MSDYWGYDIIKKLVSEDDYDIEFVKNLLAPEIGAVRRFDQIHTKADLIACLENNDELNEENVEPLKRMTNNQEILSQITAYRPTRVQHPVPVNLYQEERLAEDLQQQLRIENVSPQAAPAPVQQNYVTPAAFTENKRAAVFKKISEQLGRSWRDLGRQLNISEGAMDDMEDRYPRDLKSRILYLLKMAEEDEVYDPRQFLRRLCRGLSEAGRNDIRNRVEETMSH
ncbi:fas-associated death domain protein [Drosophila tropicalis]|uniref:fas-associated death domain protein n=1 Tax=Drosophila tropicalis TaxID=46794 RepID=UPI0035ABC912